jgi:hypothetical protein
MFWIIALIIITIYKTDSKSTDKYVDGARFNSIKCQADNTTIIFKYCYMKAISRKMVTMNIGVKFLVPYTKPYYVQFILNYRYGTIFRQVIDTHQYEWCGIMSSGESNPFIDGIISVLRNAAPGLFHKCPYEGDMDLKNVTYDGAAFDHHAKTFPQGTYRIDVFVFKNEKQTVKVAVNFEVKSALKESFG